MATFGKTSALAALIGIFLLAGTAHALSPADKCEASKLGTAGKYDFCRLKAEAKAVKTGGLPDFTKCDPKFSGKWSQAETTAAGMCPSNGDQAAIQAFITAHTDAIEAALDGAGLPKCGDNAINVAGEQCDGTDLGGETCATLGLTGGALACNNTCRFDTSGCVASSSCGTGQSAGGFCWFLGANGASCDETCTGLGKTCSSGTKSYAGSGDSTGVHCEAVLLLLGIPVVVLNQPTTRDSGVCDAGCEVDSDVSPVGGYSSYQMEDFFIFSNTRCDQHPCTPEFGTHRVCACQ